MTLISMTMDGETSFILCSRGTVKGYLGKDFKKILRFGKKFKGASDS